MRRLSSELTFFYKFLFPVLSIGITSFLALLMFTAPAFDEGGEEYYAMGFLLLGILLVLLLLNFKLCIPLKHVAIQDDKLVISNYRKRISVPLSAIESVNGSVLIVPEIVSVKFREPTAFGSTVRFNPISQFWSGWAEHPVAEELRGLLRKPERPVRRPCR